MYSLHLLLLPLALTALAGAPQNEKGCTPSPPKDHEAACLCGDEAWEISRRWLDIFSTGGISSKAELATIVSPDVKSYDDTFGPPTIGIDQLWEAVSAPSGNTTTTDVKQTPLFLLHSCDQIAYSWRYTAVTTGFNS